MVIDLMWHLIGNHLNQGEENSEKSQNAIKMQFHFYGHFKVSSE